MFILVQLKDTIRIPPEDASLLQKDVLHLIRVELNSKYSNKVLPDLGLCTLVHSILAYDEPQLYPGDAGPYIHCTFRLVVFQPTEGEILLGKITASDSSKIVLSVDFFDAIVIEPTQLPENTTFSEEEGVWVWNNDGTEYFYDIGCQVRFKVSSLLFSQPGAPAQMNTQDLTLAQQKALKYGYSIGPRPVAAAAGVLGMLSSPLGPDAPQYSTPMTVFGNMVEAGLGPIEWWD